MLNKLSAAIAIIALSIGFSTVAQAASCPPEHVLTNHRELQHAPDIGVERPVLGTVDLAGWRGAGNVRLRLRKLTIAPGGMAPTHSHKDRPSIVYIVEGEIIEHNAFCAAPILHKAGDTAPEAGEGHQHWWEDNTDKPVVIFSTDVLLYKAKNTDDI